MAPVHAGRPERTPERGVIDGERQGAWFARRQCAEQLGQRDGSGWQGQVERRTLEAEFVGSERGESGEPEVRGPKRRVGHRGAVGVEFERSDELELALVPPGASPRRVAPGVELGAVVAP